MRSNKTRNLTKKDLLLRALLLAIAVLTFLVLAESPSFAQEEDGASLRLTKTDSPDPVLVGQNLTYTLTVTNTGDDEAEDAFLGDRLPDSVEFVSVNSSRGQCGQTGGNSGRDIVCFFGEIDEGRSVTVRIVVRPTQAGQITNQAIAGAEDTRTVSASATTTVRATADLAITKTDNPDPAFVGENLTYTLRVNNNGPGAATGVTIRDTLPANAEFVSAGNGCTYNQQNNVVTCQVGNLQNGGTATREIVVRPTSQGTLNNTATVNGDQADNNNGNNQATAATTVRPSANLAIRKEGPATATNGQSFDYTLTGREQRPERRPERGRHRQPPRRLYLQRRGLDRQLRTRREHPRPQRHPVHAGEPGCEPVADVYRQRHPDPGRRLYEHRERHQRHPGPAARQQHV